MLSSGQTQSHPTANEIPKNRSLTGTVTKVLENFGFIDDSVFFQLSVVKGGDVMVGDKVQCECSYSEHLPFKWNATVVRLVHTNNRHNNNTSNIQTPQTTQVATTYLQHRLQQQQQQSRGGDDSANTMSAMTNSSQNYYSTSASGNSYSSQPSFDFAKTQQAVAAAQQLASYYGQPQQQQQPRTDASSNAFSQLQYTSTPGSAFVSSTIPFTQQIQNNLLSTAPRTATQNNYKTSNSRWERDDRPNRGDDRIRPRDTVRPRLADSGRRRNDSRDRNIPLKDGRDGNIPLKDGRDEFGRDIRNADKSKDRERERERRYKRSESPVSVSSSQNVSRVSRRRYEPVNIPKLTILKSPLNVYDIKQRYSTNLHIPSDLKEVIVNTKFSLNINEIPKPITFRVIEVNKKSKDVPKKSESPKENKTDKENNKSEKENEVIEKNDNINGTNGTIITDTTDTTTTTTTSAAENNEETNKDENKVEVIEVDESNDKTEDKNEEKEKENKEKEKPILVEQPIAMKSTYKYGVKVLILSLPVMTDIYDRLFGSDFDAISSGNKSYFLHFNKLLAFLVSRNSNDGFSLIGGKFNANLDGYLSDSDEPNLIATAVRIVEEQTGMNLSKCGKWRVISTFVYNRDSSVDPLTTNLELTRVYMPDVWSAFDGIYEPLKHLKTNNDLDIDNQIDSILTNDNLENNSEVIDKKELKNSEDIISSDATQSANVSVSQDSSLVTDTDIDSKCRSSDLSQTPINESQLMDTNVPRVESTPTVDFASSETLVSDSIVTSDAPIVDPSSVDSVKPQEQELSATNIESELDLTSDITDDQSSQLNTSNEKVVPSGDSSELHQLLLRINDLKVAELRAELEKRGVRLKGSLKKADLVTKLREIINQLLEDQEIVTDEVKNDWWAQKIMKESVTSEEGNDQSITDNNEEKVDNDSISSQPDVDGSVISETVQQSTDIDMTDNDTQSQEQSTINVNEEPMAVELTDDKTNDTNTEIKSVDNVVNDVNDGQNKETNGIKRKNDSQSPLKDNKKVKNGEQTIPSKVVDGCVYVKGGENLTVITLHEALNHQRYDQFEMSIVSEIIRESLIHHFSHYILSTLVNNSKNPLSKEEKTALELKTQLPVNYVHLSFAYFDSSHCGYVLSEDLTKLINNSNFTLSRRSFEKLVNNEDKVVYRDLSEPKELLPIVSSAVDLIKTNEGQSQLINAKIYEKNGTVYDINQLIDQSENDEKLKVKLNEELTVNQEKIYQLNEYIQELESKQKKMTIATEKQNDEICSIKRERESIKTKYEAMRKAVESSVSAFNKVLENQSENQSNK
ncbi:cell division cycle and apoptosis regulator protein 1-like isoform X2 [Oppia nitens]|nr:cell division cycle and apoptosis regulator protein 1-like isoform X2 [Oppia nitens]